VCLMGKRKKATPPTPTLYVVRRRPSERPYGSPFETKPPYGIVATFADRAEAEALHKQLEQEEAASGRWEPLWELLYTDGTEGLRELSDFDRGVFDDWLADHDIPDPDGIWEEASSTEDPVRAYFEALGPDKVRHLLAALHRFRYTEVIEVPLVVGDYTQEQ